MGGFSHEMAALAYAIGASDGTARFHGARRHFGMRVHGGHEIAFHIRIWAMAVGDMITIAAVEHFERCLAIRALFDLDQGDLS